MEVPLRFPQAKLLAIKEISRRPQELGITPDLWPGS